MGRYDLTSDSDNDPEINLAYWLETATSGDPQVLKTLVELFGEEVFQFAHILLEDKQKWKANKKNSYALILTTNTFLDAVHNLSTFRGAPSIRGWLFARLYRLRKTWWFGLKWSRNFRIFQPYILNHFDGVTAHKPDPSEHQVLEALQSVPLRKRLPFYLHEAFGLSIEEIVYVLDRKSKDIELSLSETYATVQIAYRDFGLTKGDIQSLTRDLINNRWPSPPPKILHTILLRFQAEQQNNLINQISGLRGKYSEVILIGLLVALIFALGWFFTRNTYHQAKPLFPATPEPTPTALVFEDSQVRYASEALEEQLVFTYHFEPRLSYDGRWMVFTRIDQTETSNIYLYDRIHRVMTLVDHPQDGSPSDGGSYNPSISADGRYAAFSSNVDNILPEESRTCNWRDRMINCMDVFVYDHRLHSVERISQTPDGIPADGNSIFPIISPDGRWVAFWSSASNLAGDDPLLCGSGLQEHHCLDVYLYDRVNSELLHIPIGRSYDLVDVIRMHPLSLSEDGARLALTIHKTDQIADELGMQSSSQVYVYDRLNDLLEPGFSVPQHHSSEGDSFLPVLSDDGQYMAFVSTVDGLVPGDSNGVSDVYVVNLQDHKIELISISYQGGAGDNSSGIMPEDTTMWGETLGISGDGRFVTFISNADNLTPQSGMGCRASQYSFCSEVYLHDRYSGKTTAIITQPRGDGFYLFPGITLDGNTVYYVHFRLNCPSAPFCAETWFYDRLTERLTSTLLDDPSKEAEDDLDWQTLRFLETTNSGGVHSLAFSPHSDTLAAGMSDGSIYLWQMPDGIPLPRLKNHTRPVDSLAYDSTGMILATASHDGTVNLWSAVDESLLRQLPGEGGPIFDLAFFPEGNLLAVGAQRASWTWDVRDLVFSILDYFQYSNNEVRAVAVSPDGELLAHGLSDGSLWVRRTNDRAVVARLVHSDAINAIAYSPNGKFLASGSRDGQVQLWDISQPRKGVWQIELITKFQHADWVNDLEFSIDNQWLAVASFGGDIQVWSTGTSGELDFSLYANGFQPLSITFSPDGRWLAAGSSWGGVRLWGIPQH